MRSWPRRTLEHRQKMPPSCWPSARVRSGKDAHFVVETHRGHNLGRLSRQAPLHPTRGSRSFSRESRRTRVLRAPASGPWRNAVDIGEMVKKGDVVGTVQGEALYAAIDGVLRGLIRAGHHCFKRPLRSVTLIREARGISASPFLKKPWPSLEGSRRHPPDLRRQPNHDIEHGSLSIDHRKNQNIALDGFP